MYHGLVFYTRLENPRIRDYRKKYDPTSKLIDDHISIIFPVPEIITEAQITKHIANILSRWKTFNVRINGFMKNWDHLLFLTLLDGNEDVIRLFNEMYSGILKPYFRKDLPFTPHIGIGFFGKGEFDIFNPNKHLDLDEEKYTKALNELKRIKIDEWRYLDRLTLVSLSDDLSELNNLREFKLKS